MKRAPKMAVLGMVALLVAVAAVLLLLGGDDEAGDTARRAPGCAEGERLRDADPGEAGVRRGQRVLLGCVRQRGGRRSQLRGYSINGATPCIDVVDVPTGEGGGCNDEVGDSPLEIGGRSFRAGRGERISGRTDPAAVRVRARYLSRGGCIVHTRAGYVRIQDRVALRSSANRSPFGFYVLDFPRGARPMTLEAVAREGRVLGEARLGPEGVEGKAPPYASSTCGPPIGMGVACRRPNSIACDRVAVSVSAGLYVEAVRVTVAGRPLRLPRARHRGRDGASIFEGFLQPAGLRSGPLRVETEPGTDRWLGDPPVSARVRVDVRFRGGRKASRIFRVSLGPGYG